jgi:hypothetical protein
VTSPRSHEEHEAVSLIPGSINLAIGLIEQKPPRVLRGFVVNTLPFRVKPPSALIIRQSLYNRGMTVLRAHFDGKVFVPDEPSTFCWRLAWPVKASRRRTSASPPTEY